MQVQVLHPGQGCCRKAGICAVPLLLQGAALPRGNVMAQCMACHSTTGSARSQYTCHTCPNMANLPDSDDPPLLPDTVRTAQLILLACTAFKVSTSTKHAALCCSAAQQHGTLHGLSLNHRASAITKHIPHDYPRSSMANLPRSTTAYRHIENCTTHSAGLHCFQSAQHHQSNKCRSSSGPQSGRERCRRC